MYSHIYSINKQSHDIHHILRVKRTALSLAIEEGIADLELIVLAALLHDIKDWKYSGSETAGSEAVRAFLDQYEYAKVDTVVKIIERIGYKTELGRQDKQKSSDADVANVDGSQETWMFPELAVVQDADRLDAIGAIGIARTFCYGGARNR